jgi:YebC/PmpR family DNA-binding regulatory protein
MSGHSKWSTIKRQKQAADIKRGKIFSRVTRAITVAAKDGSNPETNPKLRMAIEKAKQANMSKDKIQSAISGASSSEGANLEMIRYEGFGPGGVAIMVETVTNNRQRTHAEIKHIFDKKGGKLGEPGSVDYLFTPQALITLGLGGKNEEEAMLEIIDMGIVDLDKADNQLIITAKPEGLGKIKEALVGLGYQVVEAKISLEAKIPVEIEKETQAKKVLALVEELEGHDDTQEVYANFNIADELLN